MKVTQPVRGSAMPRRFARARYHDEIARTTTRRTAEHSAGSKAHRNRTRSGSASTH